MMPQDKQGVVDPELKVIVTGSRMRVDYNMFVSYDQVYGTQNLRIVDISIIPLHIAAHTQSTRSLSFLIHMKIKMPFCSNGVCDWGEGSWYYSWDTVRMEKILSDLLSPLTLYAKPKFHQMVDDLGTLLFNRLARLQRLHPQSYFSVYYRFWTLSHLCANGPKREPSQVETCSNARTWGL